jgi:hypothetical protein
MARATVTEMLRLPRRLALAVLLGAIPAACLSPTLPLPPPSKPDIDGPDSRGMVTLTGTLPHPRAFAFALPEVGQGSIFHTQDDAKYVLVLAAQEGEEIEFWYEFGNDKSPVIVFLVPQRTDAGTSSADAGGDAEAADAGSDAEPADAGGDGP